MDQEDLQAVNQAALVGNGNKVDQAEVEVEEEFKNHLLHLSINLKHVKFNFKSLLS